MIGGDSTLDGSVAVVTGGGRGLGRAFALALAEAGADVALAARSTEDIERVAAEVKARGRRALAVPTDVAETADVERLVERVLGELGDLDILVNNSGVIHSAPLIETPLEEWDRVVATNLRGCFLCMRAAGRHFADRRAGKVINVASNFAFMGVPNYSSYCASKAAVVCLRLYDRRDARFRRRPGGEVTAPSGVVTRFRSSAGCLQGWCGLVMSAVREHLGTRCVFNL